VPVRTASEAVTPNSANSNGRPTSVRLPSCWSNGPEGTGTSTTGSRGWIRSTGLPKPERKGTGMGSGHDSIRSEGESHPCSV